MAAIIVVKATGDLPADRFGSDRSDALLRAAGSNAWLSKCCSFLPAGLTADEL